MTRSLSLREMSSLHERIAASSGCGIGVRDPGLIESATAQARPSVDGADLYPSILDKASALGFSRVSNHPFVDGNKRIGQESVLQSIRLTGEQLIPRLAGVGRGEAVDG